MSQPEVFLGVATPEYTVKTGEEDCYFHKLGGSAVYQHPVKGNLIQCTKCDDGMMRLIAQVYGPQKVFDRVLYVFMCSGANCKATIAIRSQSYNRDYDQSKTNSEKTKPVTTSFAVDDDWGDDDNDEDGGFGGGGFGSTTPPATPPPAPITSNSEPANNSLQLVQNVLFNSFCDGDTISKKRNLLPKPFKMTPIDTFVEPDDVDGAAEAEIREFRSKYASYEQEVRTKGSTGLSMDVQQPEEYEKTSLKSGDKVFAKYSKRLARCPSQVIRYSQGGSFLPIGPLLPIDYSPPCCKNCGSPRVFETQILSTALAFLPSDCPEASTNFGVVYVFTCKDSCHPGDKYIEEHVVVESEPNFEREEL